MVKRIFLKLFCIMMAFMIVLGNVDLTAFAAAAAPSKSIIEIKQQALDTERAKRIEKLPDRVADITISDSSGRQIKTQFYLTPGTQLDQSAFVTLNNNYRLNAIQIRPLTSDEAQIIQPEFVETIFDVGNFILSLSEFNANPSLWNGFWVVMDGASVVFPGIPSISGVKRMVESSSILRSSLQVGVMQFSDLVNRTIPTGWHRHHIIEKRFAPYLGWDYSTTENNMLAIAIPYDEHLLVTNILRNKIKYGSVAYYMTLTDADIFKAHKEAYYQMYYETGDEYWNFLAKFVETGQWRRN